MSNEYFEAKDNRSIHKAFHIILKSVVNDQNFMEEAKLPRNFRKENGKCNGFVDFPSLFALVPERCAAVNIGAFQMSIHQVLHPKVSFRVASKV
ncbi:hypothetical protein RCL_jg22497.t1 [Rhizophagus clarus]|uniref:Uncharacterized protein n=1 Tax=Rhizophagus clarus TaxID=94130 RepID=A0A8H3R4A4_9GLOM|nr:hypothetical protein RCL_jg22497.t1 [Rhizophagus clarus]